jgi:hypothetical protein
MQRDSSRKAVESEFAAVNDVELLDRKRHEMTVFCVRHAVVLGALCHTTGRGEAATRARLVKVLEEVIARLLAEPKNGASLAQGLLLVELRCATETSTLLRGNSIVTRSVGAVLRSTGVVEAVEEWLGASATADGEEAALEWWRT